MNRPSHCSHRTVNDIFETIPLIQLGFMALVPVAIGLPSCDAAFAQYL
jgi:hypothetical protein